MSKQKIECVGTVAKMSHKHCGQITPETQSQMGLRLDEKDGFGQNHYRAFFGEQTKSTIPEPPVSFSSESRGVEGHRVHVEGYIKESDLRKAIFVERLVILD